MGKILKWLEEKGYHLMTWFIVIQLLIFILLIILYFYSQNKEDQLKYNIYTWCVLALFMSYMIHFAYHSIRRAYFIELVAFLIMSTLSSVQLIFYYYSYVIDNERFSEIKVAAKVIGIISIVLLILGNITYFISAYFAFNHFKLIFFNKFGAKVIYHKISSWIQFQHSMMKTDLGLIIFLIISTLIFDNKNIVLIIFDFIYFVFSIVIVICMKKSIRDEIKKNTLVCMFARILLESYKLCRVYHLLFEDPGSDIKNTFYYGFIIVISLNSAILGMIIFSTLKTISLYGSGFKEIVLKQKRIDTTSREEITQHLSSTLDYN